MASALPQLQKAYLEVETGTRIECMFNPATFAFSQANRWESDSVPGKSTPDDALRRRPGRHVQPQPRVRHDRRRAPPSRRTPNKLLKLMDVDTTLRRLRRPARQRPAAVGQVPLGHVAALVQGRHQEHRRVVHLLLERGPAAAGEREHEPRAVRAGRQLGPAEPDVGHAEAEPHPPGAGRRHARPHRRPATTATRRSGGRSPAPTASPTRSTCGPGRVLAIPERGR